MFCASRRALKAYKNKHPFHPSGLLLLLSFFWGRSRRCRASSSATSALCGIVLESSVLAQVSKHVCMRLCVCVVHVIVPYNEHVGLCVCAIVRRRLLCIICVMEFLHALAAVMDQLPNKKGGFLLCSRSRIRKIRCS